MRNKKSKNIEANKLQAFYNSLFNNSHVHGVRENALRELINSHRKLVEHGKVRLRVKEVRIGEEQMEYIKYLLRLKELQTQATILSKILSYEER